MTDAWTETPDWDAPVAKTRNLPEWKAIEDRGEHRIYEVPLINGLPIRLVATCKDQKEAELIVSLYEERRNARG